jgi:hypothetical protein
MVDAPGPAEPCRPVWFAAFLADRGTRKPSVHTMKVYRQDFDAIASLVARLRAILAQWVDARGRLMNHTLPAAQGGRAVHPQPVLLSASSCTCTSGSCHLHWPSGGNPHMLRVSTPPYCARPAVIAPLSSELPGVVSSSCHRSADDWLRTGVLRLGSRFGVSEADQFPAARRVDSLARLKFARDTRG